VNVCEFTTSGEQIHSAIRRRRSEGGSLCSKSTVYLSKNYNKFIAIVQLIDNLRTDALKGTGGPLSTRKKASDITSSVIAGGALIVESTIQSERERARLS